MRLIDADKLKESINISDSAIYSVLIEWLNQQPTIDAVSREKYEAREETRKILVEFADDLLAELKERVEVVRCKDCKWYDNIGCALIIVDEEDRPKPDDYCSYGERKEE